MAAGESLTVSVVIALLDSDATLPECLDSLARQTLRQGVEIILAEPVSTPETLKRAMEQAKGGIVALTDSRCRFPADWLERLLRAHASAFPVIGGAVEHGGPDSILAWACYFADYGGFMLPAPRRATSLLAGNHVSYKGTFLRTYLPSMPEGYWKAFFHGDLQRQGIQFLFDPELVVFCEQGETFWAFLRRYYRSAREFAAMRSRSMAFWTRVLHLLTTPALPAVLLYRRLRAAWGKKHRGKLLLSIPLQAAFVMAWSVGEVVGYLRGRT
jgi:glycosyltransferase involved in cell wall biosynthesis